MRKLLVGCSAFVLAIAVASCSSEKDPTPAAVSVTQASGGDELTLSAPDTVESGAVEIRFQNQAQVPVAAEVIGIEGNHTLDEVLAVIESEGAPIPSWLKPAGGLPTTEPGRTATATVELDEGTYFVIAEADTEDEEAEAPPPVSKTVRVSGDSGAGLPSADATITAKDYSFEAEGLKVGANEVRFENEGKEIHHLVAFPIAPGATIDEVRTFMESQGEGAAGPPPVDFTGGAEAPVLDTDKALVTTLDLKAGKYAFVCFIQDRAGGPPHVAKGMLTEVTVS